MVNTQLSAFTKFYNEELYFVKIPIYSLIIILTSLIKLFIFPEKSLELIEIDFLLFLIIFLSNFSIIFVSPLSNICLVIKMFFLIKTLSFKYIQVVAVQQYINSINELYSNSISKDK